MMRRLQRHIHRTWFAVLLLTTFAASAKPATTVHETQGRSGPGSFYPLVVLIPQGATIDVIEQKGGWYRVTYDKQDLWVADTALNPGQPAPKSKPGAISSTQGLSTKTSPTVIVGAIKGFWTRYSRSLDKTFIELPVEGYDVPPAYIESFIAERASAVGRDDLMKRFSLRKHAASDITFEREQSIGFACAQAVADAPLVENARLINYLHAVGWYTATATEGYDVPFRFYVLDTDRINAVSCPGGYIVLTRGLLELVGDESELAALLAHEMAHVIAGHGMREAMGNPVAAKAESAFDMLAQETGGATGTEQDLLQITDRAVAVATAPKLDTYEYEADDMALRYLARSGYDLTALSRLLTKLEQKHDSDVDIFDLNYKNHPDFGQRMRRIRGTVDAREFRNYTGQRFADSFGNFMVFF